MAFAFKMDLAGTMKDVLGVLNRQLVTLDTGLGKVTGSVAGFERSFLAVEGIKALGSMALRAVGEIKDLGKALLEINAHAQDLNLASRLQLGDEGAAMLQRLADSFSNTRFDDDTVKQALLPLANAGIKDEKTLDAIATAAADISARFNSGDEGFNAATEALGKIALKREAGARQLEALGINEKDFLDTVAAQMGTTADRVKALVASGKIAAPTLLNAALSQIADKQGGALGTAALAGGKTLGATLERAANLPNNLIKQLADSPAMARLQTILDTTIEKLSGPQGAALIERLGNGLANILEGISADDVVSAFDTLSDTIGVVAYGVDTLWQGITFLGDGLGWIAAQIYLGIEALMNFGESIGEGLANIVTYVKVGIVAIGDWLAALPAKLVAGAIAVGTAIVEGIADGIRAGISLVTDSITSIGEGAVSSIKSALGIHSPSRVFMEIGGQVGEGFAIGIEGGIGDVEDARRALVAAASPGAISSEAMTGGFAGGLSGTAAPSIYAPISVEVHAAPGDDGDALAAKMTTAARVEIVKILSGIAVEMGAEAA